MAMILDTNAISAVLEGDAAIEGLLAGADRHHLPAIALGEYRYGLLSSRKEKALEETLDILEAESFVLAVDSTTTRHYAAVRHELKAAGSPIPENDVWIAALARQHKLAIASRDAHFDAVRGVRRRSW
jgi:tRNA(fMet)-specific endonuclease VapC